MGDTYTALFHNKNGQFAARKMDVSYWAITSQTASNQAVVLKQSCLKLLSTSRTSKFRQRRGMMAFVSGQ